MKTEHYKIYFFHIIEAIEMPDYNFVLGVEWHPEFLATEDDLLIIKAFIRAANNHDRRKNR